MPIQPQLPKNYAEVTAPDYDRNYKKWAKIDLLDEGDEDVRELVRPLIFVKNNNQSGYKEAGGVLRASGKKVNDEFRLRANYVNVVGTTLDALIGLAFMAEPVVELEESLRVYEENVDGNGLTINQFVQMVLRENVSKGRGGILVDYPDTGTNGESVADMGDNYPILINYRPEHIRDWRVTRIGSKMVTSRLLLAMFHRENTLAGMEVERRLELGLDNDGLYYQNIWENFQMDKNLEDDWRIIASSQPTDYRGQPFDRIPWVWYGSTANSFQVDKAPMSAIADVSVAHLNTSALYEDSVVLVGQPQPVLINPDAKLQAELEKNGFQIGGSFLLTLNSEGDFKFVQAQPNTMAEQSMKNKMEQMLSLGARLVMPTKIERQTAIEVSGEEIKANSTLSLAAKNVSKAMADAFRFAKLFIDGVAGANRYNIDTRFAVASPDGDAILKMAQAYAAGGIALGDLYQWHLSNGITTLTQGEWESQLRQPQNPIPIGQGEEPEEEPEDG